MRIDAHQHFWKYDPIKDDWITDEMKVIKNDFLPEKLYPLLQETNFQGCVAVQASQAISETEYLVALAKENIFIKGVVGWIDLRADNIKEQLTRASLTKIVKGFRHIAQAEPAGFLLGEKFHRGISELSGLNFTYDILIHENQLLEALAFTKDFPDQKFVMNHIAKPNIKAKSIEQWKRVIQQYAPLENVYCKLSGLVTENNWHQWKEEEFYPYIDVVLSTFGTKRIMYGSDWPVCLLAGSYKNQLSILENYFQSYSVNEKDDIFGNNATRFYTL